VRATAKHAPSWLYDTRMSSSVVEDLKLNFCDD